MSRAGLLAACVALVAAGPARAFVRSTDSKTHACLYWGSRNVTYRINLGHAGSTTNPAPASPTCGASVEQAAIQTGFAQWTRAQQSCTDLNLVFDSTPSSSPNGYVVGGANENTVVLRVGWCSIVVPTGDPCESVDVSVHPEQVAQTCSNVYNCFDDLFPSSRKTLALTTVTYNQSTGQIFDADMELNGWSGADLGQAIQSTSTPSDAWYFTCTASTATPCTSYGQDGCAYLDLQNTATHEAGHFIGMSHPCGDPGLPTCTAAEQPTTMYPYSSAGDFQKRTLAQDDVNGLCNIYPAGGATSTCGAPPHSGGCASGGGGALPALLLALAAFAPRLRRRG